MMRKNIFLLILITFLFLDGKTIAQGWRQWRGPDMNGSTTTTNLPVEWSDKTNIVWNISLPGDNYSTPAIYNTNIFVTSSGSYGRILLLDIAMKNGTRVLWGHLLLNVPVYVHIFSKCLSHLSLPFCVGSSRVSRIEMI